MKRLLLTALALLWAPHVSAAEPIEAPGEIEAVTVYRGQALVTRRVEVGGPAGLRQVVVTGLPVQVMPGSLYAEAIGEGLAVRSVRYRTRPVEADVREEVRALDEQIQQVEDQIKAVEQSTAVIGQQRAYLDKLAAFTAATSDIELTHGVLDAETLTTLTRFQFEQREALAAKALELTFQQRALQEQLNLLRRKRSELANSSARTVREAVVFVDAAENGGGRGLRLRYLVDQAGWSPSYNVRADADRSGVTVEYFASVRQMSGEDWSDVAMTLSTATPSLAAEAPDLEPMTLALTREMPAARAAGAPRDVAARYSQLKGQRLALEQQRGQQQRAAYGLLGDSFGDAMQSDSAVRSPAGPPVDADGYNRMLNAVAENLQLLEIQAVPRSRADSRVAHPEPIQEAVSVTYRVAQRTSLPSRNDQQLIQIASLPMPGDFYRVATPVLTPYVYEEASVKNASDRVLLAGPVSAYVAGQFVGRGSIPTVAVGEPFVVGFGIDPSLRADRELVDKDEVIRGGNLVLTFDYRLSVQNFGDRPVTLRIKDRIPAEGDGDGFNVELIETDPSLSQAQDYRSQERDNGILRWDIQAPSGATGADAAEVTYRYSLAYDKQMTISGLPAEQP